jgi:hypothetical protein
MSTALAPQPPLLPVSDQKRPIGGVVIILILAKVIDHAESIIDWLQRIDFLRSTLAEVTVSDAFLAYTSAGQPGALLGLVAR